MPPAADGLARFGLAAKGVLYVLLAVLAVRIATGDGARADGKGALRAVAERPWGAGILTVLAIGFAVYAVWQWHNAWRAEDNSDRASAVGRGIVWSALTITAVRFLFEAGGGEKTEESVTARLMDTAFGPWLVVLIGLVVIGVGLSFLRHVRDNRLLDKLRPVPARTLSLIKLVTVVGLSAKSGVYVLVGAFLIRAGLQHKPRSGVGMDGALSAVANEPYGTYVLVILAGGLVAYAVWCWVRARYERVEHSNG